MNSIRLESGTDGVALLTIDAVDKTMNVLTPELQAELAETFERIAADTGIRGVVMTSGKSNGFIAGADLKDLANFYGRGTLQDAYASSARLSGIYRRIETCGKPVAAAINGLALGGGLELALACHYRVLSDSPKAVVGLPEVKLGLLPGAGGTQRLPRLIGIAQALPMMLSGDTVDPVQALKLGIVNAVLPVDQLVAAAREWVLSHPQAQQPWDMKVYRIPGGAGCLAAHAVESFAAGTSRLIRSTQRNYPAPLAIESCVFEGTQLPIDTGLRIESKYFAKLLTDPVARNLMRTMFINKGLAEKLVRRPPSQPRSIVKKLGVIGAGAMGSEIARAAATAGIEVVLIVTRAERAEQGRINLEQQLAAEMHSGRISPEHADLLQSLIQRTPDYAGLADCDLVIETVTERRDVKAEVTRKAVAAMSSSAIFASNTSTLPITGLASIFGDEERFIGLHFLTPVSRAPLIEIVKGHRTGEATLARAFDFVAQLRKTPIVVNDAPGFFTSRVFGSYLDEGMAMLAEGVEPALIENAAKMAGMPAGPLAVCDELGIELQLKVHEQAVADRLPLQFRRLTAIDAVRKMLELDRGGRRAGSGFYDYRAGGRKMLWSGLRAIFPIMAKQPTANELRERFLIIQALESARCMEEGVVTHAADADLGSVLGIGYPSWTGGPMSYIDTLGIDVFVARCERLATHHGTRFKPSAALRQRALAGQAYYENAGATERAA